MPSRFFIRFSLSALRYRKQRLLLAFGAMAVAAALATVMFGIYTTVGRRIRDEFRNYGANLVAVAVNGGTVPLAIADTAERLGTQAAPLLVTTGRIGNQVVPVAGVRTANLATMYSYWHVQGSRNVAPGKCLAGEMLASQMNLQINAPVPLDGQPCEIAGIVSTGGAEDQELIVDFETAAALSGIHDAASAIEMQAPGERLEAIRAALAAQFPQADVRTVRAVAGTESNIVVKMRAALLLLTLLILFITTLCVTSNFSEMVIERSAEIGIMKALGGAEQRIAAFFVSESATLAVLATIIGYTGGIFAAAIIGQQIFGGIFRLQADWLVLAGVGGVMLLIATVSTGIATARIWNIQPAVILRGE
jgi:putative ABC transport system permease protein